MTKLNHAPFFIKLPREETHGSHYGYKINDNYFYFLPIIL